MSAARSPADILCLAFYTLTGGRLLQGRMILTVAQRLGITERRASEMADAAAKAGLVKHEWGSVSLTAEGLARGATLTAPAPRRGSRR